MRVAISGTPGTGKTSVGETLNSRGHAVIELNDFIKKKRLEGRLDRRRGTREVDVKALDEALLASVTEQNVICIGHLAHLLTVDIIIILRCRPSVLRQRLERRAYPKRKITENVEAEACDVILVEAAETGKTVLEIDTTTRTPGETAEAVEEILAGEREKYVMGNIDWSEEVLDWF